MSNMILCYVYPSAGTPQKLSFHIRKLRLFDIPESVIRNCVHKHFNLAHLYQSPVVFCDPSG